MARRVVIFNPIFSDNVGDGLHALCLHRALRARLDGYDVQTVDVAGRQEPGAPLFPQDRKLYERLGPLLPGAIKSAVMDRAIRMRLERRIVPHWREQVRDAGCVVLGGGALFSDTGGYFPPRILALAELLAEVPATGFVLYGIGAHQDKGKGFEQLRAALRVKPPIAIFARDDGSKRRFATLFGQPNVQRNVDAGFLMRDVGWGTPREATDSRAREQAEIGIGVFSRRPTGVADDAGIVPSAELVRWYAATVAALRAHGRRVRLFTNNAHVDVTLLDAVERGLDRSDPGVVVDRSIRTADDLLQTLSRCAVVVAERLHTIIPALCLRVPTVVIGPEYKVRQCVPFLCDYRHTVPLAEASPERLVEAVETARSADPSDLAEIATYERQAAADIDRLAAIVKGHAEQGDATAERRFAAAG